eukprot:TRINITY_DN13491_c0_g1_i1.p1 TRINITY_DN13491_c0_g1~~TRINITY_DN13491_c0_g1_i1.p1  ORF type:complete len:135 (-),score=52.41 TRINITY_DN13491_c0_g1_i1:16-420(-)
MREALEGSDMGISFDDANRLRLLHPDAFQTSQALCIESQHFVAKLTQYDDYIHEFLNVLDRKAQLIEREKLKAIGIRNKLECQQEVRRRKQKELEGLISEKQAQIDRLAQEYESLQRAETEQRILMEKLQRNEL